MLVVVLCASTHAMMHVVEGDYVPRTTHSPRDTSGIVPRVHGTAEVTRDDDNIPPTTGGNVVTNFDSGDCFIDTREYKMNQVIDGFDCNPDIQACLGKRQKNKSLNNIASASQCALLVGTIGQDLLSGNWNRTDMFFSYNSEEGVCYAKTSMDKLKVANGYISGPMMQLKVDILRWSNPRSDNDLDSDGYFGEPCDIDTDNYADNKVISKKWNCDFLEDDEICMGFEGKSSHMDNVPSELVCALLVGMIPYDPSNVWSTRFYFTYNKKSGRCVAKTRGKTKKITKRSFISGPASYTIRPCEKTGSNSCEFSPGFLP